MEMGFSMAIDYSNFDQMNSGTIFTNLVPEHLIILTSLL